MKERASLADYSTDELLAEIVRRRNALERTQPPEHFCDDCANFIPNERASDSYNPCRLKHKMSFWMPDMDGDPHQQDWGFYRRVCADRRPAEVSP